MIDRVPFPPAEEFQRRYVETATPVIFTGATDDWPALRKWSFDGWRASYGDRPITVGHTEKGRLVVSAKGGIPQSEIQLGEFLDTLEEESPPFYMLSPVEERLPELMDDVRFPEVCRQARWKTSRIWVGAAGTTSRLHRDWPENLFAQIVGRKRFILIDKRLSARVYSHSRLSKVPNFSRVDIENPDYARFPKLRGVPQLSVVVEPGELLYIPRMWWHHVRSLEPSISINLWFGNGLVAAVSMLSQAYARLRKLRL